MPSLKKQRALTQEALDAMLDRLDPDQDTAGIKYEEIRRALIRYLRFGGSLIPEEHADEAINICADRIYHDKPFDAANPKAHFFAVARNILRDYRKNRGRRPLSLEELPRVKEPSHDPDEEKLRLSEREESDRRTECLNRCLSELRDDERELIRRYYLEEKALKTKRRREMAGETGRSINALRVKAHRVRKKLERCCGECMKGSE